MNRSGAQHLVRTSLILGVQFDDSDYRRFLQGYCGCLKRRFPEEEFEAFSPNRTLDELIERYEDPEFVGGACGRFEALRRYTMGEFGIDLRLTASDFGPFEQRQSPYSYDRATYHVGKVLSSARVVMEFPGYNPYRATRRWSPDFVRENLEHVFEILPDYLWWSMHDKKGEIEASLDPEVVANWRLRLEAEGFKTPTFGLYLTTMESLHMPDEEVPT